MRFVSLKTNRSNQTFEKLFWETVLGNEKAVFWASAWYLVQCPENVGFRETMCASIVWQGMQLKYRQIVASLPLSLLRTI